MNIQFNTDKTVSGDDKTRDFFTNLISDSLKHYSSHITRVEVHLSDENGVKEGVNDIRCLLEARLEGMKPIVVTHQADNVQPAVSGATNKLKASLKKILERKADY